MIQKNPAVDLQARYRKTFEAALIAALALAIVAFKFFPDVAPPKPLDQGIATPPMIAEVPLTSQPKKPPPPPRPPIVIEAPADEAPVDVAGIGRVVTIEDAERPAWKKEWPQQVPC